MRLTHLLCLILLDFWPGQANNAESDPSCRKSHQLEEGFEVYMHSVVKPLMEYFKQINQKLDKNAAEMESKNSQIRELEEKLIRFQIEDESKKNYTIQMEEKMVKLQMENSNYKTKEDSLSAVLKELTSQTLKIEELQNKLCEKQNNQINDLKEQCQLETQKNIKCDSEVKNQKEIIVSMETKILQSELEVKDKSKQIENFTQEIRLLNVSKEQQNKEIGKLNVKINLNAQKLTECNIELNSQKERTEAEISLKDKNLEIEAKESVAKSKEIESMKQQMKLLNSSNSQLSSENTKLNDMIGWTIIQQRVRGGVEFYRNWTEYKNGFGDFWDGDFFLGLETIHRLTSAQPHELFILMEYYNSDRFFAKYEEFAISGEGDQYRLSELGKFSGNTSDELSYHIKSEFSTPDSDNDGSTMACTTKHRGGWWYHFCTKTNLNGVYFENEVTDQAENIFWGTWKQIKEVRMMIRPKLQQ